MVGVGGGGGGVYSAPSHTIVALWLPSLRTLYYISNSNVIFFTDINICFVCLCKNL